MFSWRRKAPRERRRRKHVGGSGSMLPQEIFKIEYSETPFPAFLEPRKQFPRQCWRSLKFSLKSKLLNDALVRKIYNTVVKKIANIDLKVPDVEWQTTGRNVRPPASNENPGQTLKILLHRELPQSR